MPDKDALRAAVFKAVEDYCAADFGYSFDPKNPIVRLHEPTFSAGEINAALECLLSTYVTMGPKVKKFEEVFCSTFGWMKLFCARSKNSPSAVISRRAP